MPSLYLLRSALHFRSTGLRLGLYKLLRAGSREDGGRHGKVEAERRRRGESTVYWKSGSWKLLDGTWRTNRRGVSED